MCFTCSCQLVHFCSVLYSALVRSSRRGVQSADGLTGRIVVQCCAFFANPCHPSRHTGCCGPACVTCTHQHCNVLRCGATSGPWSVVTPAVLEPQDLTVCQCMSAAHHTHQTLYTHTHNMLLQQNCWSGSSGRNRNQCSSRAIRQQNGTFTPQIYLPKTNRKICGSAAGRQ